MADEKPNLYQIMAEIFELPAKIEQAEARRLAEKRADRVSTPCYVRGLRTPAQFRRPNRLPRAGALQ
jgi:hypothetical protein